MSFRPPVPRWLLVAFVAVGFVLRYALQQTSTPAAVTSRPPPPDYAAERAAKDSLWRTAADSPLPDSAKRRFRGLAYFPPDDSARVVATYTPLATAQPLLVPLTHTDAPAPYMRVGRLTFRLHGRRCTLTALRAPAAPATAALFVPFTDATTGRQSYGGGRYLDVPAPPAAGAPTPVLLDFNRAYAPACAHAPGYECPIPPAENALPVAVRAGEREGSDGQ